MKPRNIGIAILLSVITCGLYGLYWFVCLTDDANILSGRTADTSGGVALLLTIVTCNIYELFWAYKMGEKIGEAQMRRGLPADQNNRILYLLLSIFGLSIIAFALMQNELNHILELDVQ